MSVTSHVEKLREKHEALSKAVEQAERAPASDSLDIVAMKREKLRLKEEISRLAH